MSLDASEFQEKALSVDPSRPGLRGDSGNRWYVVHTQPHSEMRALDHLQRQAFGTFCPCTRRTVRHARKIHSRLAPLFPSYVFVRLDLSVDQWRSINSTYGVARLVVNGERPSAVPGGVIEALLQRTRLDGTMDWGPSFEVGQEVRISHGPFARLVGTLEYLDAQGRVRVLLNLLGQSVPIVTRTEVLEPAAQA